MISKIQELFTEFTQLYISLVEEILVLKSTSFDSFIADINRETKIIENALNICSKYEDEYTSKTEVITLCKYLTYTIKEYKQQIEEAKKQNSIDYSYYFTSYFPKSFRKIQLNCTKLLLYSRKKDLN